MKIGPYLQILGYFCCGDGNWKMRLSEVQKTKIALKSPNMDRFSKFLRLFHILEDAGSISGIKYMFQRKNSSAKILVSFFLNRSLLHANIYEDFKRIIFLLSSFVLKYVQWFESSLSTHLDNLIKFLKRDALLGSSALRFVPHPIQVIRLDHLVKLLFQVSHIHDTARRKNKI